MAFVRKSRGPQGVGNSPTGVLQPVVGGPPPTSTPLLPPRTELTERVSVGLTLNKHRMNQEAILMTSNNVRDAFIHSSLLSPHSSYGGFGAGGEWFCGS